MNLGALLKAAATSMLLVSAWLRPTMVAAQAPPSDVELARRIVAASARIKPGDVVVVAGGKHTIPLMEAIAIEAMMAGAFVHMMLDTYRVARAYFAAVPEHYLSQVPTHFPAWLRATDVWINLPAWEEEWSQLVAGIPEARIARAMEASAGLVQAIDTSGVRLVTVGYPSEAAARAVEMTFEEYSRVHRGALAADYAEIARAGEQLSARLRTAGEVRIMSPAGTDLTMSMHGRPVIVDDGVVTDDDGKASLAMQRSASLPGGRVLTTVLESSAQGKVVVPRDRCRDQPVRDVRFTIQDGRMSGLQAGQGGECIRETLEPYSGPKDRVGGFSIGLNPVLRVVEEQGDWRPDAAAGMVYVHVGGNEWFGGENRTQGTWWFPITRATVLVDGHAIVRDGRLALDRN